MENLDEALATLITKALEGVDTSVGFLQAELPDVVTQLLMWHGVRSGAEAVFSLLLFLIPLFMFKLYKRLSIPYQKAEGYKYSDCERYSFLHMTNFRFNCSQEKAVGDRGWRIGTTDDGGSIVAVMLLSSATATIVGLLAFNLTWLQIWIAPKVWLLEYAARMVG